MSHDLVDFDGIEITLTKKEDHLSESKIVIENMDEVSNNNSTILEDYDQKNCTIDNDLIKNELSYLEKIKNTYKACNYIGATADNYKKNTNLMSQINSLKDHVNNDKKNKLLTKINTLKTKFPFISHIMIDPTDSINTIESKYCDMRLKVLEELNQIEEPEKISQKKSKIFGSETSFIIYDDCIGVTFSSKPQGPMGVTGPYGDCGFKQKGQMGVTGPYDDCSLKPKGPMGETGPCWF